MGIGKAAGKVFDAVSTPFYKLASFEGGILIAPAAVLTFIGAAVGNTMMMNDINKGPALQPNAVAPVKAGNEPFNAAARQLGVLTRTSTDIVLAAEPDDKKAEAFKNDRNAFVAQIMFDPKLSEAQSVALARQFEKAVAQGFKSYSSGGYTLNAATFAYRDECRTDGAFDPGDKRDNNVMRMTRCMVDRQYQQEQSQLGDFSNFAAYMGGPFAWTALAGIGVFGMAGGHAARKKRQSQQKRN